MMRFLYKIWRGLMLVFTGLINRILFWVSGVKTGKRFNSCGLIGIRNYAGRGHIVIGDEVYINSNRMADPIGGQTRTLITAVGEGRIIIGDNVGISNSAIYSIDAITIGNGVVIGGGCKIYDNDFHSIKSSDRLDNNKNIKHSPVIIRDQAFICGHSIILKGVTIGKESVIAAGAVVTKDVPDRQVWGGNPAIFIKKVSDDH